MSDHLRLIVLACRIHEPSRDNIHKRVWSMRVCGGQTHLTLIFNGASSWAKFTRVCKFEIGRRN